MPNRRAKRIPATAAARGVCRALGVIASAVGHEFVRVGHRSLSCPLAVARGIVIHVPGCAVCRLYVNGKVAPVPKVVDLRRASESLDRIIGPDFGNS